MAGEAEGWVGGVEADLREGVWKGIWEGDEAGEAEGWVGVNGWVSEWVSAVSDLSEWVSDELSIWVSML